MLWRYPTGLAEVGITLYALLMPKFVIEPARTPEMPMRRT
jgi:hypothetical protein